MRNNYFRSFLDASKSDMKKNNNFHFSVVVVVHPKGGLNAIRKQLFVFIRSNLFL